jgi:uncharacterized protein YndB with AHSA1/START domain
MMTRSFSTEILISAQPESVYNAITMDIDQWWTELSNQAHRAGDQLIVRFEKTTSWVMTISESLPNRSLVWEVVEANHDEEGITKKDEWKGTSIQWKIVDHEMGSKVTLTHEGLVPALECYGICEAGWGYFLGSLKSYLETGAGYPYKQ